MPEQVHHCPECDKAFNYKSRMIRHLCTVHENKTYNCQQCSKTFNRTDNLKRHIEDCHKTHTRTINHQTATHGLGEKQKLASSSDQPENNDIASPSHVSCAKSSTKDKERKMGDVYRCPLCDKTFNNTGNLNRHRRSVHENKTYDCPKCSKGFSRKHSLKYHIEEQHHESSREILNHEAVTCGLGDKGKMITLSGPREINEIVSPSLDSGPNPSSEDKKRKLFRCPLCDKNFSAICNVNRHRRIAHENIAYDCQQCSKTFKRNDNLNRHVEDIHKKHICAICREHFTGFREFLKHHTDTHGFKGKRKLVSSSGDVEGYVTEAPAPAPANDSNKSSHTREKRQRNIYFCPVCDMIFMDKLNMHRHRIGHDGETAKPFSCKVCFKEFARLESPKCHDEMRHHKYMCTICGENLNGLRKFQNHQTITHGVREIEELVSTSGSEIEETEESLHASESSGTIEAQETGAPLPVNTSQTSSSREQRNIRRYMYTCHVCNMIFKRKSHLARHKARHDTETPTQFSCRVCFKRYRRAIDLRYHDKTCHQKYKCTVCGETICGLREFQNHQTITHGVQEKDDVVTTSDPPESNDAIEHLHVNQSEMSNGTVEPLHVNASERFKLHVKDGEGAEEIDEEKKGSAESESPVTQSNPETRPLHKKSFFCEKCGMFLRGYPAFFRHMNIHTRRKSYKCELCGKTFTQKHCLDRHQVVHTGSKIFSCDICGNTFGQLVSLHRHKKNVHKIKSPMCRLCNKTFQTNESLENHQKLVHFPKTQMAKPKTSYVKQYPCGICGRVYLTSSGLSVHKRLVHSAELKPTCSVCNRQCSSKANLRRHMLRHEVKPIEKGKPLEKKKTSGVHKCPQCKHSFFVENHLKKHMRVCYLNAFHCKICKKAFKKSGALKMHMTVYHLNAEDESDSTEPEALFQCGICKRDFSEKPLLESHMAEYHMDEKDEIGPTKSTSEIQAQHATDEQGDSNVSFRDTDRSPSAVCCHICKKQFNETSLLLSHVKTFHADEKGNTDYTDPLSAIRIEREQKVQKHHESEWNNGERESSVSAFRCDKCMREFRHSNSLKLHMTSCHKITSNSSSLLRAPPCTNQLRNEGVSRKRRASDHQDGNAQKKIKTTHVTSGLLNVVDKSDSGESGSEMRKSPLNAGCDHQEKRLCGGNGLLSQTLFQCGICKRDFSEMTLLEIHMAEFHVNVKDGVEATVSTTEIRPQTQHIKKEHDYNNESCGDSEPSPLPVRCDICEMEFNDTSLLMTHVKRIHLKGEEKAELYTTVSEMHKETERLVCERPNSSISDRESERSVNASRCYKRYIEFNDSSCREMHNKEASTYSTVRTERCTNDSRVQNEDNKIKSRLMRDQHLEGDCEQKPNCISDLNCRRLDEFGKTSVSVEHLKQEPRELGEILGSEGKRDLFQENSNVSPSFSHAPKQEQDSISDDDSEFVDSETNSSPTQNLSMTMRKRTLVNYADPLDDFEI